MENGKPKTTEITIIDETSIRDKIYEIRGQKVMLDFDLAEIYGYSTKAFNQQVKNNIEKFDDDFRFQLTKEEIVSLSRSKKLTSIQMPGVKGGRAYLPWCFTESGIYMLMTVLKGDLATQQSKLLIRIFKGMKDYIVSQAKIPKLDAISTLALQTAQNTMDIAEIKEKMVTKDDLIAFMKSFSLPDKGIEYVIYAGQTFEADAVYADIYSKAKKTLYIVDNYIGPKTLLMLKSVPEDVDVIIFSDNVNNILRLSEYRAFHAEYPNIRLSFQRTGGKFHDRYIIIDYRQPSEQIYHCGASSMDAGRRITTISRSDNAALYYGMIEELLKERELRLN